MALEITSTAFPQGQTIPKQFTADGRNIPPPLSWTEPPSATRSFALICEDPDAPRGTFTHWIAFNLSVEQRELSEGGTLSGGALLGANDFGKVGYGGPAPPPGKPHSYYFKLYALDTQLDLPAGAKKDELLAAMKGHTLAEAQLIGTYGR